VEPAGGAGGKGEGPVVCLGDAFDDRQAEADTCMVVVYAFGGALERLGERGDELGVSFPPVFSTVSTTLSG
jgi:hypothetical protein